MKNKIFYIFALLSLFLFTSEVSKTREDILSHFSDTEAILTEGSDSQNNYKESESHNLDYLQPQAVGLIVSTRLPIMTQAYERLSKLESKIFVCFHQKEHTQVIKTTERVSASQAIKVSYLRLKAGYWIYVLRKIII